MQIKEKIKVNNLKKNKKQGPKWDLENSEDFELFNIVTRLLVLDACYCQVRN